MNPACGVVAESNWWGCGPKSDLWGRSPKGESSGSKSEAPSPKPETLTIMKTGEKKKSELQKAREDLVDFAVDREDVKWLMDRLPEEADIKRVTVEYELQILKIIGVGWSLSFYLENSPQKTELLSTYWEAINEFSQGISTTTEYMIGRQIDYFEILKERLEMYVAALSENPEAPEPAQVVGPEFARICGNADDIFTFMTGSKMFISTLNKVKTYLEAIKLR